MDRVLGVFAKEPRAGQVKTRLAEWLGVETAARLYEAFLNDFLARVAEYPARRVLAYSPSDARDFFTEFAAGRFEVEPQCNGDLGTRMAHFFGHQFHRGASQVVLVGSDAPDLPLRLIDQSFTLLADCPAVLGPAYDGGYYLIGMTRLIPDAFRDVPWGRIDVWERTLAQIRAAGIEPAVLEAWHDVDRPEDLKSLALAMLSGRSEPVTQLPHTWSALQAILDRL